MTSQVRGNQIRWLYSSEANERIDNFVSDWADRHSRPAEPVGFPPSYYRQRIADANKKPFDVEKMRKEMREEEARQSKNDLHFTMFLVKFGITFFILSTIMVVFHVYPFN